MGYTVRSARTGDVRAIRGLIDANLATGLLDKPTVTLYEDIQEFVVAVRVPDGGARDEQVIGCGALHVMWEDLAEIRTIAVAADCRRLGIGGLLVGALLARATELGVRRVFVLTFAVYFFGRYGFEEISGAAADPDVSDPDVFAELLRSADEGVAEFLDLDRVKPNTLGNTRMLLRL
ncbi:MAG: amino-acid N-acetyltransferase [Streptosporangiaceae bacterium]